MTAASHRPGSVLKGAALGLSVGVAALVGSTSVAALGLSIAAAIGLIVGVTREMARTAALSIATLSIAVFLAGADGAAAWRVLPAVAGIALVWEYSMGSMAVAAELDGGAVERMEALHVVTTVLVGGAVTGLAYVAYRGLDVGGSIGALALLAVAATALALAVWR